MFVAAALDDRHRGPADGLHRLAGQSSCSSRTESPSVRYFPRPGSPIRKTEQRTTGFSRSSPQTVLVTAVALLISTPSVGRARPVPLGGSRRSGREAIVQPALEIFVGIPSVVWGWLGITTLVPFLAHTFHDPISLSLPIVGQVFSMPGFLLRLLLAGGLAGAVDHGPCQPSPAFRTTPSAPSPGAPNRLAGPGHHPLGKMIRHLLLPAALSGVLTAVVLA